jgi:hypothetical protein
LSAYARERLAEFQRPGLTPAWISRVMRRFGVTRTQTGSRRNLPLTTNVTQDGTGLPVHAGSGIKSKFGTGGISAQTRGTILTRASCTALRRSAQYGAQLRSLAVNRGQPFSLHVRKLPSQSPSVLVFQAGHASSILVTRSRASLLVKPAFSVPRLFEHPGDKND